MIRPRPIISLELWLLTKVSRRPPVMKVAWMLNTEKSKEDLAEVPGRVLRGAIMFSSSILEANLDLLSMSIVAIDGLFLRSFTTRRGISSKGMILNTPVFPFIFSCITWPATQGKLPESLSSPVVSLLTISEYEKVSGTE